MIAAFKMTARCLLAAFTLLMLLTAGGAHAQNNAAFTGQTVPTTMVAGAVYNVSVRMTNTGATTWSTAGAYSLGSKNPQDNATWGGARAGLPGAVAPNQTATIAFQVNAPKTPGTYNFQWRMVQDFVEWFGATSPNVVVTVTAPRNDAQVISTTVPAAMTQGKTYTIAVTLKNTGNTTWAPATHMLGSQNPHDNRIWNSGRAALNSAVAPGAQTTFSFPVVAPVPGSYNMQWKMLQEYVEWFGGTSSSAVAVSAGAGAPTVTVTRSPSPMVAGQSFALNWSTINATSLGRRCISTGTGFTVSDAPPINGSTAGTASSAWVNYPSTCTWTATGAGGSASYTETMSTNSAVGDVVTYIHTDGLGSPVTRSDSNGNLVSTTRYEPYGATATGATPTIGFTGHVNDADTGLVYMQQRYYDPVAGRFLSIDPVTTDSNTASSFNRYNYAANNPYRYIDPDGRSALDVGFLAVDVLKLGLAVYSGVGVGAAAADVALSVVGVASPIPGTGQFIKGILAVEHVSTTVRSIDHVVDGTQALKKVHGNTANAALATLYEKYGSGGDFLKHGVTKHDNPAKRYTKNEINGGTVVATDRGPRSEILKKERQLVETNPGPANRERWAGKRRGIE